MKYLFGIDLGTTNSVISIYKPEGIQVINIKSRPTTPSVVAFNGSDWLVGVEALNYGKINPSNMARSVKRHMGEPSYRFSINNVEYTAIELSAKILQFLKNETSKQLDCEVVDTIITVPAWFKDSERQATIEAAKLAGLNPLGIINEPTSAAIAYFYNKSESLESQDKKWLVYDLGGGTFDVSVVSVKGDLQEVLSSCGNTFLGGDDFDQEIILWLSRHIKEKFNINPDDDKYIQHLLKQIAEDTKIQLSSETEKHILEPFKFQNNDYTLDIMLKRSEYESMITKYIDSTIQKTWQAIEESGVSKESLERILLVGGATRTPLIRTLLADTFNIELDIYIDPDLSISMGASIQAALKEGLTYSHTVIDIATHSLGIAAFGEEDVKYGLSPDDVDRNNDEFDYPLTFSTIIRKNSRLPAKHTNTYFTNSPYQREILVVVFQGESKITSENHLVGSFRCSITPSPDIASFDISFEYDSNSIVKVAVLENNGSKVIKKYAMNLQDSAENNSELNQSKKHYDAEVDVDIDTAQVQEKNISNFLIDKVRKQIALQTGDVSSIKEKLTEYEQLLLSNNTENIDEIEDYLYNWLEASE